MYLYPNGIVVLGVVFTMIKTERLELRSWKEGDARRLFQLASDPLIGPSCGWMPHCSIDESRNLIAEGPLGEPESYAICLKDTGTIIGSIRFKDAEESFDIAEAGDLEVGYWLGSAHWDCGYASEALDALIHHAFDELGRKVLWCGFFEGNMRSRRCIEKHGFEFLEAYSDFERPLLGDTTTLYCYRLIDGNFPFPIG